MISVLQLIALTNKPSDITKFCMDIEHDIHCTLKITNIVTTRREYNEAVH